MRQYSLWLALLFFTGGFLFTPCTVRAGSFEVAPTTLTLSSSSSSGVIHLTNRGNETVFAQVEGLDWHQEGTKELLTPSSVLHISPPIVRLAPGRQQTIRLLASGGDALQERAFRLSISELPDPAAKADNTVHVLLQFLVPVFISGSGSTSPRLTWKTSPSPDGMMLTATNEGSQHLKIWGISVKNAQGHEIAASGKAFNYLLPGASHQWKIANATHVMRGERLSIQVHDEAHGILKDSYVVE